MTIEWTIARRRTIAPSKVISERAARGLKNGIIVVAKRIRRHLGISLRRWMHILLLLLLLVILAALRISSCMGRNAGIALNVPQATTPPHAAPTVVMEALATMPRHILRCIEIFDAELCNRAQPPRHPTRQDLTALFLAESGAWEVATADERNDIHDELVRVEYGINDDGDDACEEVLSVDFRQHDDEAAGLKHCRTARHDIAVAALD